MQWNIDNNVLIKSGTVLSNNIAAFNFDGTLAWSDSGDINITGVDDWVAPSGADTNLRNFIQTLKNDHWTFVIFIDGSDIDTEVKIHTLKRRMDYFIETFFYQFYPFVYISTRNDLYRKPSRAMWNMFLNDSELKPSPASFYCGNENDESDTSFAANCGLAFYTYDTMIGKYIPPPIPNDVKILLIMASHWSQYEGWVENFIREHPEFHIRTNIQNIEYNQDQSIIVIENNLTTRLNRRLISLYIPENLRHHTYILMFTRPIYLHTTKEEYENNKIRIRNYGTTLDYHPNGSDIGQPQGETFPIIRIN